MPEATRLPCSISPPALTYSPPFGQADLSNCERELINLAGSIQPHGFLLVLSAGDGKVLQASANAPAMLGLDASSTKLIGTPVGVLPGNLAAVICNCAAIGIGAEPLPIRCQTELNGLPQHWEGALHEIEPGRLIVELEPVIGSGSAVVAHDQGRLLQLVAEAVHRLSNAASLGVLADTTVQCVRDLIGIKFVDHHPVIADEITNALDSSVGKHAEARRITQTMHRLSH